MALINQSTTHTQRLPTMKSCARVVALSQHMPRTCNTIEGFAEDHFFRRGRTYLIKYVQAGRNVDNRSLPRGIIGIKEGKFCNGWLPAI